MYTIITDNFNEFDYNEVKRVLLLFLKEMGDKNMNRSKLKLEGKKWVDEEIITAEQLDKILARYPNRNVNIIIVIFAILLTSLAIITFIFSDWAQVPHFSRTAIMIVLMILLYVIGNYLFNKQSNLYGISFIILGYIVFGAAMLLTINIYSIQIYSAWPFIIWILTGLLLYVVYDHKMLFVVGIVITTIGQIYSGGAFASFNWFIFLILIFGYAHFVYHQPNRLYGYLFGASFTIQVLVLTISESQQYYWLIVYFLILYLIADIFLKDILKKSIKHMSLLSIFILGMFQTFLLQEEFFRSQIEYQVIFVIIWGILIGIVGWNKYRTDKIIELTDLVLFLPVFLVPFSHVISIVILFTFSVTWLVIGYRIESNEKILLGIIAFLLSTFTAYIQYAWDAMNKSLFFLIAGILLFVISVLFEKQRRTIVGSRKGGDK